MDTRSISMLNKGVLVEAVCVQLETEVELLSNSTAMARAEATGGESRPENKYDTRALEASYLAAGQGQRLLELRRLLAWFQALDCTRPFKTVVEGAAVRVEDDSGRIQVLFVGPVGGSEVKVDEQLVRVISLKAPLGRALRGLSEGEVAELVIPAGTQEWEILELV
jgi:transcription elongation GreA/GreB family factor